MAISGGAKPRPAITLWVTMPFTDATPTSDHETLLRHLRQSPLLDRYVRAFRQATGLSLWLTGPDTSHSCEAINPFCRTVTHQTGGCEACERSHSELISRGGQEAVTVKCFARLRETAVPVRFGRMLIGHLRTGQVFAEPPKESHFQQALKVLREDPEFRECHLEPLRAAYFSGKVLTEEHYQSIIDLLVIFGVQLSCELERIPQTGESSLPEPVGKVCRHLKANFDSEFSLETLAGIACLSPHHLCTVFKSSTGMTLTEFQNRHRILQAKKRLASRHARINEVALDVGFGSLSQFNRSFRKYAGLTPTEFRTHSRPAGHPPSRTIPPGAKAPA